MPWFVRLAGMGFLVVFVIGCATRPQEVLIEPTYSYEEAVESTRTPSVAVVETEQGE